MIPIPNKHIFSSNNLILIACIIICWEKFEFHGQNKKKRTYVSATLDIFIQCRSNWVFKKRIWKRQSISTWACEWSVLNKAVKNQIHNNPSHRPLSLRPLWCPCCSAVRVCVQDSESVCHPQSHTLTVIQRQRWVTIQSSVSYIQYTH